MRRLAHWLGGAVWGIAAYRLWKRWQAEELELRPEPAPVEDPDERVEELRAKLAETRAGEHSAPPPPPSPAPPVEAPPPPETLDERRRRVHEEGRAAIDEMRSE